MPLAVAVTLATPEALVTAVRLDRVALAPLAGVFYLTPAPDDPPFVSPGERIAAGQVVGLIESMKMFNQVLAEVSGVVAEIAAGNGEIVHAGQPLMFIDPEDAELPAGQADMATNQTPGSGIVTGTTDREDLL